MKIKHLNNSFFQLKTKKMNVVCDPWLGKMDSTANWSYPNTNPDLNIIKKLNPDVIYISHLHTDHYDEKLLKNFKNKKTKIIIKNFPDKKLKKMLNNLGFFNIQEVEAWKSYSIRDLEFTLIPMESGNSAGLPQDLNYDLDTSILFHDKSSKLTFYNNVDNPILFSTAKKIKKIIKKKYNKLDIIALCPRSASAYPQNFINCNKLIERKKIINKTFLKAKKILKILKPDYFVPAGGSYHIYGKFMKLHKFVAHPTNTEITNYFKKLKIKTLFLDCGSEIKGPNFEDNIKIIYPKKNNLSKLKNKKYDYQNSKVPKNLDEFFDHAKKRYNFILKKLKINFNWKIKIYIYDDIKINKRCLIDNKDKFEKVYELNNNRITKKSQILNCYMDKKLFYNLLIRKNNWTMSYGGSLIFFSRKPNIYKPDVINSLNFLQV